MDGLLIIDKPEGLTSHDVVARVRRILKTKRVGHTGTLDPFATGVLVLLIGKATRLAQFLDKDEKEYEAVIHFGYETDTGDKTGARSAECGVSNEEIAELLRTTDWETVFDNFRGEIEQTPPMYSAKKQGGKKLYELARQGKVVERKPINVKISTLKVLDSGQDTRSEIRIRVVCSAGTYIRTLAEDIGRSIGIGAHLTELRRKRAGAFSLKDARKLDELESTTLIPMGRCVSHLSKFQLERDRIERTRNGLSTRVNASQFIAKEHVQMVGDDEEIVAIGVFDESENSLRPTIVLG